MDEKKKLRLLLNVYLDSIEGNLRNLDAILLICNSIQQYRFEINDCFENERLQNNNLLFQKAFLHGQSINKLAQGINIMNLKSEVFVKTNDPLSLHILFRGLLETYLTSYLINVYPANNDEKELMHSIWKYHGLYWRQKADFSNSVRREEADKIQYEEKRILDALELEIKSSDQFQKLKPKCQNDFFKRMRNDWKGSFKDGSYSSLSYPAIIKAISLRGDLFSNIYNYLSWSAHSNCISLFQLRDIYKTNDNEKLVISIIRYTCFFLSFMTYDLIINDSNYVPCYQRLPQDLKDLINFFNVYFRGDEFSLEKNINSPIAQ